MDKEETYLLLSKKLMINFAEIKDVAIISECLINKSHNPYEQTPDGYLVHVIVDNNGFEERIEGFIPKEDWGWIKEILERMRNNEKDDTNEEKNNDTLGEELSRDDTDSTGV